MIRLLLPIVLLWGAADVSPTSAAAEAPAGVLADGQSFRGNLAANDRPDKLRFAGAAAPREVAAGELVRWGNFVPPARGARVLLVGGGLIVADRLRTEKDLLLGDSEVFGALKLPLEQVAGLMLRVPAKQSLADQLAARIATAAGQSDRILLDNGDELSGSIHEIGDHVVLQTEQGNVDVDLDRTAAVIFNPTLAHKPRASGLRMLVGLRDGSLLTAVELAADHDTARLKLAGGAELTAPWSAIVALQPLGGRAVYLSDLKPASYKHIPYLQLAWPYRTDASVLGSQLRAGGKLYLKGLGMHSPARITYELDEPYRRFEVEAAIDDEAGPRGSVVFRVFTDDGSGTWQERATTQMLRGGDAPVPLGVDLAGAKRISLLVDFGDRGDELDHADWLDARLVR